MKILFLAPLLFTQSITAGEIPQGPTRSDSAVPTGRFQRVSTVPNPGIVQAKSTESLQLTIESIEGSVVASVGSSETGLMACDSRGPLPAPSAMTCTIPVGLIGSYAPRLLLIFNMGSDESSTDRINLFGRAAMRYKVEVLQEGERDLLSTTVLDVVFNQEEASATQADVINALISPRTEGVNVLISGR